MTVVLRDQEVIVASIKAFIFRLDLILIIAFFLVGKTLLILCYLGFILSIFDKKTNKQTRKSLKTGHQNTLRLHCKCNFGYNWTDSSSEAM